MFRHLITPTIRTPGRRARFADGDASFHFAKLNSPRRVPHQPKAQRYGKPGPEILIHDVPLRVVNAQDDTLEIRHDCASGGLAPFTASVAL